MDLKLSSNMEDYLEAIYVLELKTGNVRVKDIAAELGITMPSVSSAIKNLEKQGFVSHPRYDLVVLTPRGARVAADVYHRHRVIKGFLSQVLGVASDIAEKDACCIEHIISPETLESLSRFLEAENGRD